MFVDHRKLVRLLDEHAVNSAARWFFMMACIVAFEGFSSTGFIPQASLSRVMPCRKARSRALNELVRVGLVTLTDTGVVIARFVELVRSYDARSEDRDASTSSKPKQVVAKPQRSNKKLSTAETPKRDISGTQTGHERDMSGTSLSQIGLKNRDEMPSQKREKKILPSGVDSLSPKSSFSLAGAVGESPGGDPSALPVLAVELPRETPQVAAAPPSCEDAHAVDSLAPRSDDREPVDVVAPTETKRPVMSLMARPVFKSPSPPHGDAVRKYKERQELARRAVAMLSGAA